MSPSMHMPHYYFMFMFMFFWFTTRMGGAHVCEAFHTSRPSRLSLGDCTRRGGMNTSVRSLYPFREFQRNNNNNKKCLALSTQSKIRNHGPLTRLSVTAASGSSENKNDWDLNGLSTPSSSSSSSSLVATKKSLWTRLDNMGMALKPRALDARRKALTVNKKSKKIRWTIQSCLLFTFFIAYRAYRGFFVLLPAVFRQVYIKMEQTVECPFVDDDDDDNNNNNYKSDAAFASSSSNRPFRLRTAVTVTLLTTIVTLSYALTGALRVVGRLLSSPSLLFTNPTNSFAMAAEEMIQNESKIIQYTTNHHDHNAQRRKEKKL